MQSSMKDYLMIAVTGGIGSGKSLATAALKNAGFYTLSADKITAELYKTRRVKKLLKSMFPTAVTGIIFLKLNRAIIASQVFSNKEKLQELTDAITPLVMNEIERKARAKGGVTVAEVPLLFECNFQDKFKEVLVVTRPLELRIESVMARSNLTREQVLARINNQVDYSRLDLSPYTVIENDCEISQFQAKVVTAVKNLIK